MLATGSRSHIIGLTLPFIKTHFNPLKKKNFRKTLWKKVKLLKMSNFTLFHNVFCEICMLKSFNGHISVVVCYFFEFWTVSKWCAREWVKCTKFMHKTLFGNEPESVDRDQTARYVQSDLDLHFPLKQQGSAVGGV